MELTFDIVQLPGQLLLQLQTERTAQVTDGSVTDRWLPAADGGSRIYLLHLGFVLRGSEGGWITFLLQIHPHELVDGQLTGGRVLELGQSEGQMEEIKHDLLYSPVMFCDLMLL